MFHFFHIILPLLLSLVVPLMVMGQTDTTQQVDISGEASVVAWKNHNMLGQSEVGHTRWNFDHLQQLPQIMGNANPLRYAQQLPSVQTSNEYDAGMHVQGCSSGQNAIMIGECVIYNPSHLFGIFSTFNTGHFSEMDFSTLSSSNAPNRIGGFLKMELPSTTTFSREPKAQKVHAEASVGPLSSQATLKLRLSPTMNVVFSARQAYMNLLYGKWLCFDNDEMHYSFGDYNATIFYHPTPRDRFTFNGYWGYDNAGFYKDTHRMDTKLKWENYAAECTWEHHTARKIVIKQSLFSSGYSNLFTLDNADLKLLLQSHIRTHGYKLSFENTHWTWGTEYLLHQVLPQAPKVESNYYAPSPPVANTTSSEVSAYGQYQTSFFQGKVHLSGSLKTSIFISNDHSTYFVPAPQMRIAWNMCPAHSLTIHASISHQMLHQVGFTSLGLPTEFWFASDKEQEPQHSENLSCLYNFAPTSHAFSLTAEVYVKRLHNQKEYGDNVLSLLQPDYNLKSVLLSGKGYNYGIGLQLSKLSGRLTGWMSYAFGRSIRQFDGRGGHYPSNYERKHEVNLVANYRLSPRVSLCMTGVAASGTPFTAAQGFYLINGYIIAQYGHHNAHRLPWYKRIDLSADIQLKAHRAYNHGINVSLLNACGFNNKLFYRLTTKGNTFAYRPIAFLKFPLPSISYHLKF